MGARAVMIAPLVSATKDSRSSYLRVEAFSLLSLLYNISKQDNVLREEVKSLQDAIPSISTAVESALKEADMTKSKRFRLILQAIEVVTKFALNNSNVTLWSALSKLGEPLKTVSDDSQSEPIKNLCSNIIANINKG